MDSELLSLESCDILGAEYKQRSGRMGCVKVVLNIFCSAERLEGNTNSCALKAAC